MSDIFFFPRQRALDSNATPAPGWKLSFYKSGTSTRKDTFADENLTTPNTNPVVADAEGEFSTIYLAGEYKVVLTDQNDVQQWTVDPFQSGSGGRDISADNIKELVDVQAQGLQGGETAFVRAFYSNTDTGGGHFYWDADRAKSDANGGTIIDPDNVGTLSATALGTFASVQGTGVGTGCWVKLPRIEDIETLTDLQALPAVPIGTVYVRGRTAKGDGYEGHFTFRAADHSTAVTNDTNKVKFVPPDSDATGASGVWEKISGVFDNDITVTVGSSGTYSTINAALKALSPFRPLYKAEGIAATVNLLSGFTMAEQVLLDKGVDLGWITITSVDAEVTIDRSALTTQVDSNRFPAFHAIHASTLPSLDALFVMDSSGTATARDGVFITENSRAVIERGAGVKAAGGRALHVQRSSVATAQGSIWDDFIELGIRCGNAGEVYARDCSATNGNGGAVIAGAMARVYVQNADLTAPTTNAGTGINATEGAIVEAEGVDVTGRNKGLLCTLLSQINAVSGVIDDCGDVAVEANAGGRINCSSASITGAGADAVVNDFGTVNLEGATVTGATGNGLTSEGGLTNIRDATISSNGSGSTNRNIYLVNAKVIAGGTATANSSTGVGVWGEASSEINGPMAVGSNSSHGVRLQNGSRWYGGSGSTVNGNGANGIFCLSGSYAQINSGEVKDNSSTDLHVEGGSEMSMFTVETTNSGAGNPADVGDANVTAFNALDGSNGIIWAA